jgi:tRNA G46 methylase TrmB
MQPQPGNSPPIRSNQRGLHPRLLAIVQRNTRFRFARPAAPWSRELFAYLDGLVRARGQEIILDSGCGNGSSTAALARGNPDKFVIGFDKSAHRTGRAESPSGQQNFVVVRGECVDLWRLIGAARWPVAKNFLLYPNPWPKAKHLRRRWYAHPVFPEFANLGDAIELRSNWRLYVEEFAVALTATTNRRISVERIVFGSPLTPFERKYLASGQRLYRLQAGPVEPGILASARSEGAEMPVDTRRATAKARRRTG